MNPIDQSIIENNVLETLENSGRIGKSKVTTITFDGEITGKPFFDWGGGMYIVKISDIAVPIENIKMASVKSVDNNVIGVPKEQMSFIEEVSGLWGMIAYGEGFCWICYKAVEYEGDNYEPGVYAIRFPSGAHITSLVAETIHPVDQKFIPGAVLPVVELSSKLPDGESVVFTEEENAKLTACIGKPIVLKCATEDGLTTVCTAAYSTTNGIHMFNSIGAAIITIMSEDGIAWAGSKSNL